MKHLARILRLGAFGLACCCLALAAGLLVLEQSGWLLRRVRAEFSSRLEQPITITGAHLRWFRGAIEFEGIGLDTPGGGLFVERATVTIGRGEQGWTVRRVELRGGHAVLSQDLVDRLRLLLESDQPTDRMVGQFPTIAIQGLQVDYSDPDWGYVPLGLVDVLAHPDEFGKPVIEGRIIPTLAVRAKGAGGALPEIYLGGHEVSSGRFEIHGSTEGIPVNVDALPEGTGLEVFRPYAPRGVLALDAQLFISLDGSEPPSGKVRAALTGGSILPTTIDTPFEDLRVELFARCQPEPGVQLLNPKAWQSTASLDVTWHDSPISAWALFGRNSGVGLSARGWVTAHNLPLSRAALGGLGIDDSPGLSTAWKALALRGVADVFVGLRAPSDGQALDLFIDVQADGAAGVTYVGWPSRRTGVVEGVPLPVEDVSGRLLIALDTRRETQMMLGWLGVDGAHSGAQRPEQRAHSDGLVISPAAGEKYARFDLRYGGEALAANEQLRIALQGLTGTDFIWPMFQPAGGASSFEAHMIRTAGMFAPASRFDFELRDLAGSFTMLPAPLSALHGSLELVFDQRRAFGAAFELEGRSATSEFLRVSGRIQEDAALPRTGANRALRDIDVTARGVALRGIDRDAVAGALPGIGAALEIVGAVGKVDVNYRTSTAQPGGPTRQTVTITPGTVEVSPQNFKVRTTGVRGRVLVQTHDQEEGPQDGRVTTRLQPLLGDWSGGARVAVLGEIDASGAAELQLMGAGLDVSNRVLAGAVREVLTPGEASSDGVDLGALAIDGRVDFIGELTLGGSTADRATGQDSSYRIFLRDNDLETNSAVRFGLEGLHGSLVQRGKVLYGESITARLGKTPLTLRGAEFSMEEDGTYRFETRLEARDLPLDREHMRHFLDEPTLEALVEGLGWSGRVDIDDALLRLTGSRGDRAGEVEFQGHATLTDMELNIGLPLSITRASVNIESLILKNGHVRAWATVDDLDGHIADRKLEDARLALTYIEPHLSLLDLEGRFGQGHLRNLGTEGSSGPAFSIDLQEPFHFGVAVRLVDVDVSRLLRGLFESEFASEGKLSAELRLVGDLNHITGIRGDGRVDLTESTLWSIPVMRDLFSQLGFDNTAVFEEMRTRFRIAEGVVHMEEMQVESPLLSLVGEGALDFDGRLNHELRVHYDLIDHFGPLTRLAYFIQNNLLRVSIRGDMSRPRVELQGALSFLQGSRAEGRELPLPPFAPLPERF